MSLKREDIEQLKIIVEKVEDAYGIGGLVNESVEKLAKENALLKKRDKFLSGVIEEVLGQMLQVELEKLALEVRVEAIERKVATAINQQGSNDVLEKVPDFLEFDGNVSWNREDTLWGNSDDDVMPSISIDLTIANEDLEQALLNLRKDRSGQYRLDSLKLGRGWIVSAKRLLETLLLEVGSTPSDFTVNDIRKVTENLENALQLTTSPWNEKYREDWVRQAREAIIDGKRLLEAKIEVLQ